MLNRQEKSSSQPVYLFGGVDMTVKANQSLYKNVLMMWAGFFVLMGAFAYFFGFEINAKSLLVFALYLVGVIIVFAGLFLLIDGCNQKYLVFDNEKIIERYKGTEKHIVSYLQIIDTKYHNRVDILGGMIDFGYVEITYKQDSKSKGTKSIWLYLSKKHYQEFLKINKLRSTG